METYREIAQRLGTSTAALQKKVWEFNRRYAQPRNPILPDGSRDGGHFKTQLFNEESAQRIEQAFRTLKARPKGRPKTPTPAEVK